MKTKLLTGCALAAFAALAEIEWPSDFQEKLAKRLETIERQTSSDSGTVGEALDTALVSEKAEAWSTDFWSWAWSELPSAGGDIDFSPSGMIILVR